MVDLIKFQPYLNSLLENPQRKTVLGDCYISTFAELKVRVNESSSQDNKNIQESYLVLDGLRKYASEQVLLSGKPGSGKSTALLELEFKQVEKCLNAIAKNNDLVPQIPVLIELRGLKKSVLEAIQEKLGWWIDLDEQALKKLLREQRLLVLLDALNESPNHSALQEVEKFRQISTELKIPLIITSRELGSSLIQGTIKKLEMSPLTEPQMRDFVNRRLPETGEKLLRQLQGKLKELGQTPLLLQMLCEVFSEKGEIPQNRGDLFRKEFNRRYKKFKPETLRNISEDSRRFTFDLLCYLAFRMMQGDPHIDPCQPTSSWITISKIKAESILTEFLLSESNPKAKTKEWLEDLLEWHLLQIASEPESIEFHHQLFQEYYAGEYLAPLLEKLSDEELQQNYLNYLKWTESIEIAVSFIESETLALRITKLALDIDLKLGAVIAGSVKSDFKPKAISLISQQQIPDRFKIYLLGETKSSAVVDELIEMMNHQNDETCHVLVWASRKLSLDIALPIFNKAIKDPDSQLRDTALRAIGEIDINQAVNFAINHLPKEMEASVRETAVICILSKSESEAAILQLLRCTEDEDHNVNTMSAYGLEQMDRQKVLSLLTKFLKGQNNDLSLRILAAEQLGELGDENVVADLFNIFLDSNKYSQLSATADMSRAKILERIKTNPQAEKARQEQQKKDLTKHWLKYINSTKPVARGNAVINLAQLLEKSEAINLVKQYLTDRDHYVRGHAIMSLTTLIGKDALTQIMKSLKDPNPQVYHEASKALIEIKANLPNEFDISQDIINKLIENLSQDKDQSTLKDTALTLIHLFTIKPSLNSNENLRKALYDASFSDDNYFRSQVAKCLGEFSDQQIIKRLLELIEDSDFYVSLCATEAIKNIKIELIYQFLPYLKNLTYQSEKCLGLDPMITIQSRCGFYNYEIANLTEISSSSNSVDVSELLATIDRTTKESNKEIKQMADKPSIQMNFHGSVENAVGNVEGDMNINNAPSSQEEAVKSVIDLLANLRQKYPNASDTEIIDIMTKTFENISDNNPQKWQSWQNIFSLLFIGGTELVKLAQPITAIPIEVVKQLHKIYTDNRKQLPDK